MAMGQVQGQTEESLHSLGPISGKQVHSDQAGLRPMNKANISSKFKATPDTIDDIVFLAFDLTTNICNLNKKLAFSGCGGFLQLPRLTE